jgi:hypothetical protein
MLPAEGKQRDDLIDRLGLDDCPGDQPVKASITGIRNPVEQARQHPAAGNAGRQLSPKIKVGVDHPVLYLKGIYWAA